MERLPLHRQLIFQIKKAPELVLLFLLLQHKSARRRLNRLILINERAFYDRLFKVPAGSPHLRSNRLILRGLLGDIPSHVYIWAVVDPLHIDDIPIPPKAANGLQVSGAGRVDNKMVMISLVPVLPLGDVNIFEGSAVPLSLRTEQFYKFPHTVLSAFSTYRTRAASS